MVLVALIKVPDISVALFALVPPVSPPVTEGAAQLYSEPAGTEPLMLLVGVTAKVAPLQIEAVIALITAKGLMATLTVNTAPVQLPDRGVIM